MKIYVASSWRNIMQPGVVAMLRSMGHEVYDFKNPEPGNNGFSWALIDPGWMTWTPEEHVAALQHPVAQAGFARDMKALRECDVCVLVLPCGRSAHLELGWAAGHGKKTYVLEVEPIEPDLMYLMCDRIFTDIGSMISHFMTCRHCGCTDDRACEGGCFWVSPNLCSACAERGKV